MAYFSGQGRVYIGERDALGNPKTLMPVGNVPELKVNLSVETLEHKESQTGQRLTDLTLIKEKKGEFACTLEELLKINLELALYGSTATQASGSVTDETLPTPAAAGGLIVLAHQNVSDVIITDSTETTPKTLPAAQYRVNGSHGSLVLNDITAGGPYVEPFKASYTFGAAESTALFTKPLPERWVRFEGLNTADGNRPVVIDLYRVSINPAKELSVITDELLQFELSGNVLADLTKPQDSALGQFGRIVTI
ncbi:MAG: hypothetical protein ACOZAP_04545 [Pseudomonadota bacterium]